jgi:hypothetical protein
MSFVKFPLPPILSPPPTPAPKESLGCWVITNSFPLQRSKFSFKTMCEQFIDQRKINSNTDQLLILIVPPKQLLGDLKEKEGIVN